MSTAAIAPEPVTAPLVVRTVTLDVTDPTTVDLISLLPANRPLTWLRRGNGLVGWGEAARIQTFGPDRFRDAQQQWEQLVANAVVRDEVGLPGTGPVAFGSFAFDDLSPTGGTLIVPEVLVGRRGDRMWITTAGTQLAPIPPLHPDPQPLQRPGTMTFTSGALTPQSWQAQVAAAVATIRHGDLDKVVLARDIIAATDHPIDVRWLLQRLVERYESCWTFSVDGLVGATPELLVRVERGLVTSRVLAGTIRRTGHDDADIARAAVLAHSSKDLEEHEYAVRSVAGSLHPYCSSTNVPDVPFVLPLPNVLHLASDITGVLGEDTGSLDLAAALHPTAAVCGTPTDTARELIRELEHMDRGRYAGPVGWMGADGDGEWGIGLRSAHIDANHPAQARLFAGCGVVAASDPASELAESEAKLEPMRYALGLD